MIVNCKIKFTRTGTFCILITIIFSINLIFINQYSIETEINKEIMQVQSQMPVIGNQETVDVWKIEIPKISLVANISERTTKKVLNQYIGHFEETSRKEGNIGLAAHNRGNEINYFENLKLLTEGDEIKYTYNGFEKIYEVEKCRIIRTTELEYLEQTEDNMLTLITYVENQPEYRRCVQASEKEEEIY